MKKLVKIGLIIAVLVAFLFPNRFLFAQTSKSDIFSMRTETSKTFGLGNGDYRLEVFSGAVHYKDNYNDLSEAWKNIDLIWEGNKITKAPYELTLDGKKITVKDKKTGNISTLELLTTTSKVPFEIIPGNSSISFRSTIDSTELPFQAQFKVIGSIPLSTNAFDDAGNLVLGTSFKNGILTETLSSVIDLVTNTVRLPKGDIKIDPTLILQPSGKDAAIVSISPTTNYGSQANIVIERSNTTQVGDLIEFDISALPAEVVIDSASLGLYYYQAILGTPAGRTYNCYRVLRRDWVEAQATWNIYKTGSNWTTAGCSSDGNDYTTNNGTSATVPAVGNWMNWDVLNQVKTAYDNSWTADFRISDNAASGSTRIQAAFYSKEAAGYEAYMPRLVIDYTILPPTVVTQNATNVEETTATLNGEITAISGDDNCTERGFEWGTGMGVYTENWTETGDYDIDTFSYNATGLTEGELYYFRAKALSAGGWGYGEGLTFLTKPDEPSGLTATVGDAEILLDWTSGDGTDNTTIYGKIGDYPTDRTDPLAVLVYAGTDSSYTHTGLIAGDHWYYRAWSWCTEDSLEQWSDSYDQIDLILVGAPTNLTLTDLGAITVSANWTPGLSSTYTMLRASYNDYPASTTEGELMYYGSDNSIGLASFALETTKYYFVAIGYHSDNITCSYEYARAIIGGEDMETLAENVGIIGSALSTFLTGVLPIVEAIWQFLIAGAIIGLAFWRKNIFLYILATPVSLVYGLGLASENEVKSLLWVAGVIIALIGTYCLIKVAMAGFERIRG